jgi:hypothetical protein
MLVHAGGQLVEGHTGDGHGPEGRTEAAGPDGGGEAFAGNVGDGDKQTTVGLLDKVEVVSADFVAGYGAEGQRVAADGRELLRQERSLNGAGGVQILLYAGELDVSLVVAGIFEGDSGLEREAFNEVELI